MAGDRGLVQPGDHHPPGSRKFMIRYRGYWKPGLEVVSPDGTTPLYHVRSGAGWRPQMIVSTAAAPDIVLGTVGFHWFSSRIDVQVRNSSFTLRPRRWYVGGFCYASPAWNGENLRWKRHVICLYEGKVVVAKLWLGHGGFKNIVEVEVDEAAMQRAPGGETAVIEEAIMVGLVWIELRRRQSQSQSYRQRSSIAAAGDTSSCS